MKNKLSLLKYCIPCESECCEAGDLIGSPILDEKEASELEKVAKGSTKKVESENGIYYVIIEQKENEKCYFLTKDNKCQVQDKKPLDCLCYPLKAIHIGDSIKFIVHTDCRASKHLSEEFINNAKIIALSSINRFDKETYQHWLDNYDIWAKDRKEFI